MNVKEALQRFARKEKLDQPTIKQLYREGYIEASDVTNFESSEQELLPTFITKKADGSWKVRGVGAISRSWSKPRSQSNVRGAEFRLSCKSFRCLPECRFPNPADRVLIHRAGGLENAVLRNL
jgi:hypothetical protein